MKSNRNLVITVVAALLMFIVIGLALFLTFSGIAARERYEHRAFWNTSAPGALSVNITDMTGDQQRDVFVQNSSGIKLLNAAGQVLLDKPLPSPLTSTQGDMNGDGLPDIVAYTWDGERTRLLAFTGLDERLWEQTLAGLGPPGRAVALDFENDGRSEVVIGDQSGQLVAMSAQGEELWRYTIPEGNSLRGLDEVPLSGGDLVVAGDERSGLVVILDQQGQELWRTEAPGGLRRLRAIPLGGPLEGRVLVGSVSGLLTIFQGDTGQEIWSARLGQAVNEIRAAEVDGDPATSEVIAAGKDGGIWAYSQNGQQLWTANVGSKVSELAGLNVEGLSGEAIIVGDDDGGVTIFGPDGAALKQFTTLGSIGRVEVGKLSGETGFIVADQAELAFYRLEQTSAPFWYTPLLGAFLACVVIAVIAVIAASTKPAPTLQVSADAMTVEAQRARRRMLHESIADLRNMQGQGEIPEQAFLARLKDLRGQLAQVNESLMKLGESIKVETIACPHCGGSLDLGSDRCEYCGQVVIV